MTPEKMVFVAVSALLILSNFCASHSKDVHDALLNQEFDLPFSEKAVVQAEELEIVFSSVLEDSRCAKGEQCITQGNGRIELTVSKSGKSTVSIQLNTAKDPQEATVENYKIKLVDLKPYPVMSQTRSSQDYVATLLVTSTEE